MGGSWNVLELDQDYPVWLTEETALTFYSIARTCKNQPFRYAAMQALVQRWTVDRVLVNV